MTEENPHDKVGRCSMEGTGEGKRFYQETFSENRMLNHY